MNSGISVIICCYNSEKVIARTILHLAKQKYLSNIEWEIILVDNNCIDQTTTISSNTWKEMGAPTKLIIVKESISGLSYARKKGLSFASFDYIVFCDDDNWLDDSYLKKSFEILKNQPNVGAVGGRSIAASNIDLPNWFYQYQESYAVGIQALKTGDVSKRGYLWGAGIVIRKELIFEAYNRGFKYYLTGRKGNELLAGDDSEICKWILLLGYDLWYDESLKFQHFIADHRLDLLYLNKMQKGFALSDDIALTKYTTLLAIKYFNSTKKINFLRGMFILFFKPWVFTKNKMRIQFLIGPIFKISNIEDYKFIKTYYNSIYYSR